MGNSVSCKINKLSNKKIVNIIFRLSTAIRNPVNQINSFFGIQMHICIVPSLASLVYQDNSTPEVYQQ